MSEFIVEAEERAELGKNANRRLRVAGKIPGVLYGADTENVNVAVDPKHLLAVLSSESGRNTLFSLKVKNKKTDVMIRDFQLHPIRNDLIHVDFLKVAMDQMMEFEVPVEPVGTPVGVKTQGGLLDQVLRAIELECLPGDVPDHIKVDVADLEIGDVVRVSDIKVDTSKIVIKSDPELVVVTVQAPRVVEEAGEGELEEEMAEPEVIKKGKAEEAED